MDNGEKSASTWKTVLIVLSIFVSAAITTIGLRLTVNDLSDKFEKTVTKQINQDQRTIDSLKTEIRIRDMQDAQKRGYRK